jgi:hypothetical protein
MKKIKRFNKSELITFTGIIIVIIVFVLSFYIEFIDKNYDRIIFMVLAISVVISTFLKLKNK